MTVISPRLLVGLLCLTVSGTASAQILETETARFLGRGGAELGVAYELQTSVEGREHAIPIGFEYGFTRRLMVLVEPVPYTAIRPRAGRRASGPGDLEVTASWLANRERGWMPALAFAGEVKIPTARDTLIGTKKADYAFYAIASKASGRFDSHANISFTLVGKPAGSSVSNTVFAALATEYHALPRVLLFGEVLAQTAAVSEQGSESGTQGQGVPELGGNEVVGTLGAGFNLSPSTLLSFSVSRDNRGATLFRPRLTFRWIPSLR